MEGVEDGTDKEGVICRQGNTGVMDQASKGSLESEFGTSKDEDVVKQILEKGSIVEAGVRISHARLENSCDDC